MYEPGDDVTCKVNKATSGQVQLATSGAGKEPLEKESFCLVRRDSSVRQMQCTFITMTGMGGWESRLTWHVGSIDSRLNRQSPLIVRRACMDWTWLAVWLSQPPTSQAHTRSRWALSALPAFLNPLLGYAASAAGKRGVQVRISTHVLVVYLPHHKRPPRGVVHCQAHLIVVRLLIML